MLVNSNYTVGQYFLASSILNSSFKRKSNKFTWVLTGLIVSYIAFISNSF